MTPAACLRFDEALLLAAHNTHKANTSAGVRADADCLMPLLSRHYNVSRTYYMSLY